MQYLVMNVRDFERQVYAVVKNPISEHLRTDNSTETNVNSILAMNIKNNTIENGSRWWEAENVWWRCRAWRAKGTSGETTMQIPRHFVWQAATPLCIYAKAWRDTEHTALLSERSHARAVTPNGWPLPAMRPLGQTSPFKLDGRSHTHTHTGKHIHLISGVKRGRTLRWPETWCQKLNNWISGSPLRWKVLG